MNGRQLKKIAVVVGTFLAMGIVECVHADDFLSVSLITSDTEVFVNDGLSYKVLITNESRSQVTISGPVVMPRFSCLVEWRLEGGDWLTAWDDRIEGRKEDVEPGLITIPLKSTWTEYGQVFLTRGKRQIFEVTGKYEIRAKVSTAIGTYLSQPVPIKVVDWPKNQVPLDKRFVPFGRLVLHETMPILERHLDDLTELCQTYSTGGVAKSVKLLFDVESYERDGAVAGKAMTRAEAFKVLAPGLDEVRRDQLAFLLGNGAVKDKQWKDVALLLDEIKVTSNRRRSLQGQLDGAIQTGEAQTR